MSKKRRLDRGHINIVWPRYKDSSKCEKSKIVKEFCVDYGVQSKAVIRAFSKCLQKQRDLEPANLHKKENTTVEVITFKKTGRPEIYKKSDELIWWLQTLWVATRKLNAKALKQALPYWLKQSHESGVPENIKHQLLDMSASTMERLLQDYKRELAKQMRCTTKRPPMKILRQLVPLRPLGEDYGRNKPGYCQADTVAHCGSSLTGEFAWTVNMTCVVSGWCEQEAIMGKKSESVLISLEAQRKRLPFFLWALHFDNGSEFMNSLVVGHFDRPKDGVIITRGRPYKKNDQAQIEQKNWTHVRQLFGYYRYDTQELVDAMNNIYRNEHRLLQNFFIPQSKLIEKVRVGSQIKKKFDKPKTPYHRLMESQLITNEQKDELKKTYNSLNPFHLSEQLNIKLKRLESLLLKPKLQSTEINQTEGNNEDKNKKAA